MPILRFILRYLANNEQLVSRLADSKPMRRAAQLSISLFHRSKMLQADFEKSAAGRHLIKRLEHLANRLKAIEDSQKKQK